MLASTNSQAAIRQEVRISQFQNLWSRNPKTGKLFFFYMSVQISLSVLLAAWSTDSLGTGTDFSDFLQNYYLDGVTNIDVDNSTTLLKLISNFVGASGLFFGIIGAIHSQFGVLGVLIQGKTTYTIFTIFAAIICISEILFGVLDITAVMLFINKKNSLKDLCVIQLSSFYQDECQSNLDNIIQRIYIQLLGPSVLMLLSGISMIASGALSVLAKMNVPVNLKRLRMREARAARKLQMLRDNDHQRQLEQKKIQHAFRMLDAFQMVDLNSDGTIDSAELQAVLSALQYNFTEDEVQKMISDADMDGDGKLDYQEFIRMMMEAKNESMVKILEGDFD